jgi:hypothetical protein
MSTKFMRHLMCGTVLLGALITTAARAQTGETALRDVRCDDAGYPAVVCDVALPSLTRIDDATLSADVHADGRAAHDAQLRKLADPAAKIALAVVIDAYAPRLRAAQFAALRDTVIDLPGAAQAQLHVLTRDRADRLSDELPSAARRAALRDARSAGAPRLFDALCDVIDGLARDAADDRALLVVASGLDARSTRCRVEDVGARARAAGVAILAVSTGSPTQVRALDWLAQHTDGAHVAATGAAAYESRWSQIGASWSALLARVGARYRISARIDGPPDGQVHSGQIRLRSGAIVFGAVMSFTASPARPAIAEPALHVDNRPVEAHALPDAVTVTITPRAVARQIARVEFVRDGRAEVALHAPFSTTLASDLLLADQPTPLLIRVYGDHAGALVSEHVVQLARAGTPASAQLKPGSAVHAPLNTRTLLIVLGLLSAVMLIVSAWVAARARRATRMHMSHAAWSTGPLPSLRDVDAPTVLPSVHGGEAQRTLRAPLAPPVASLRLISGRSAGQEIAVSADAPLTVGRGPDATAQLAQSPYVSATHARVELRAGALTVTDLRSVNGTRVNGALLAPGASHPLCDGDRLACADVEMDVRVTAVAKDAIR